jgi:hypothetical protein
MVDNQPNGIGEIVAPLYLRILARIPEPVRDTIICGIVGYGTMACYEALTTHATLIGAMGDEKTIAGGIGLGLARGLIEAHKAYKHSRAQDNHHENPE